MTDKDGRGGGFHICSQDTVNDGKWHHVALVHTKQYQAMYLDGKLQGIKEGSYVNSDRTIVYNQLGSGLCDRWKYVV